jgi:hypothetical protein
MRQADYTLHRHNMHMRSILNKDRAVGQKMVPEALMLPSAPGLIRGLPFPTLQMRTPSPAAVPQPDIVASGSAFMPRSQPKKAERISTGVYYDNREVRLEMHPSHIRFSKVCTSVVPELPLGKPMPQPPRALVATNPLPSVEFTNENLGFTYLATKIRSYRTSSPTKEASLGKKHKLASEEIKEESRAKRQRVLSKDQLSFVEAALALSGLGAAPPMPSPSPSTSPYKSPNSVMLALPPPPFFMLEQVNGSLSSYLLSS